MSKPIRGRRMPAPVSETGPAVASAVDPNAGAMAGDETRGAAGHSVQVQPPSQPNQPEDHVPERRDLPERLGRYQVRGVLGEGRFGRVYDGFDDQLHRRVAIKVPAVGPQQRDTEAFLNEARRLARLSHPGIVVVHDVGVEAGHCFIVSEFVPGPSLRNWLLQQRPAWQQAAIIAARVADALAHAHAHATIHRDVKPANIILDENLNPVLIDFGLALGEKSPGECPGLVSGTPMYMSPEQARGAGPRIDGRTDIYSLGVVLYEMLSGQRPFQGEQVSELLRQVCEDQPPSLRQLAPEVPEPLEQICRQAMSKRVSDRFGTAGDMALKLRDVLRRLGGVELPPSGDRGAIPRISQNDEQACPECGQGNSPRAAYCGHCGSCLSGADPGSARGHAESPASRSAPPVEVIRRHVTILACQCEPGLDVDADEHHELLQILRQLCDEAAARYGGLLLPVGPHVQICFGFPSAWENTAERAVRCGRQILADIGQLGSRLAESVRAPTASGAIHSGEVVIEHAADHRATLITIAGDVAAIAQRLTEEAGAGTIVVSESTRRLIGGGFSCQPLGVRSLKQARQPIPLYQVVAEMDEDARSEWPLDAPLVGRDAESALLRRRWEQTREGMGQLVAVVGEAGIGKTRLVRELGAWAIDQDVPAQLLRMHCSPFHSGRVLYPVTDLLARRCRFVSGEAPDSKVDKLVRELDQVQLADEQSIALLAALLSIPLDDRFPALSLGLKQQKEHTYQLLTEWLARCADIQPVLLVIENLHWADESTRQLCELLARRIVDRPLMTLLTFRPSVSPAWSVSARQTQLVLNRLTRQESELLARQVRGAAATDPEAIRRIVAYSDGVPLMIEQLAGIWDPVEPREQAVEPREQAAEPAEQTAERMESPASRSPDDAELPIVPPRICDLLTARLDPLVLHPQVVQTAAALGPRFDAKSVLAVTRLPAAAVRRQLERLVDDDLLRRIGQWPDCQYQFRHALLPPLICRGMLRRHLRQLQQRIVELGVGDTA